jgi:hypothetical protein
MATIVDCTGLLPPSARAELDRYPLTPTECAPHANGPLGAVAGWYYCGAGCWLLALALHQLTGLPLAGVLRALGDRGAGDLPLELMLDAGVARDAHLLCACGWRASVDGLERLAGVSADRVRALCAATGDLDPDDPPTLAAARAAAALLLERVGLDPA